MPSSKVIYLGIKGSVIALDASSGNQIWTSSLIGSDFVNVVLDGDNLYATTQGEIFCLNPVDGQGRWSNKLKGFGLGLCSIASETITPGNLLNLVAEFKRQSEAATAASSQTIHSS
jgi:outer membrane protein assembly factor BamB